MKFTIESYYRNSAGLRCRGGRPFYHIFCSEKAAQKYLDQFLIMLGKSELYFDYKVEKK